MHTDLIEPKYDTINFFNLEDMTYQYLLQAIEVTMSKRTNLTRASEIKHVLSILSQNYIYADHDQISEALFLIFQSKKVEDMCKNSTILYKDILEFCDEVWTVTTFPEDISFYMGKIIPNFLDSSKRRKIYDLAKSWNYLKNTQLALDIGKRENEVPLLNEHLLLESVVDNLDI